MSGKGRYLKKLYNEGTIQKTHLENAVKKDWITLEEKNEILNNE